ncbi:hypothetical protein ACVW0Y_004515 [Pseudomonas sp. TE3786]
MINPILRNFIFISLCIALSARIQADESSNWWAASQAVWAVPCMDGLALRDTPKCVNTALQASCKEIKNEAARAQCYDQMRPTRRAGANKRQPKIEDARLANVLAPKTTELVVGAQPYSVELLLADNRAERLEIPPDLLAQGPNAQLRANDKAGSGFTKAVGDFDGDDKADSAVLKLEKAGSGRFQLVVALSGEGGRERVLKAGNNIQAVGIRTLKPGSYTSACSKGYGPATSTCTPEVKMAKEGISLFTFESAASLFYLEDGRFKEISLAD